MLTLKPAPMAVTLKQDIDKLFDRLLPTSLFGTTAPMVGPANPLLDGFVPALDVAETPAAYIVRVEVPGIPRENLDVTLNGALLTVTGHREFVKKDENETFFWREREEGKFARTLRLPMPVDEANIVAALVDGVLTVTLPKVAPAATAKITIA